MECERERASGEINITKPRAGLLQGTPVDVGHVECSELPNQNFGTIGTGSAIL